MKTGQQSVISIKLLSLQIQLSFLHGLKHRNQFNCWHTTQHTAISLHQSIADPMNQFEIRISFVTLHCLQEYGNEILPGPQLLTGWWAMMLEYLIF